MVDLGADACVAFILDRSPGATHAMRMARAAGIETLPISRVTTDLATRPAHQETLT